MYNHMYDGNYQMKTTTTERYDDNKYDEDKRDPPLQSNRLDPQRARCYRAEAGCSASPPDDDDGFGGGGGGGGQTTSTNNRHNISAPHIITTTNHLMEQDMTGWHIDHNCTVPFVLRLVN